MEELERGSVSWGRRISFQVDAWYGLGQNASFRIEDFVTCGAVLSEQMRGSSVTETSDLIKILQTPQQF